MAKIKFDGLDKYSKQLADIGEHSEGIVKYAVYEGAAIIADAVKANTPVDTGDLRDSIALAKMKNENGYVYTELTFTGYDRKGTSNKLKARAIESGTSFGHRKNPFVRRAVTATKPLAEAAMAAALEKKLKEYMDTN